MGIVMSSKPGVKARGLAGLPVTGGVPGWKPQGPPTLVWAAVIVRVAARARRREGLVNMVDEVRAVDDW